jgi:hypothetical protein
MDGMYGSAKRWLGEGKLSLEAVWVGFKSIIPLYIGLKKSMPLGTAYVL